MLGEDVCGKDGEVICPCSWVTHQAHCSSFCFFLSCVSNVCSSVVERWGRGWVQMLVIEGEREGQQEGKVVVSDFNSSVFVASGFLWVCWINGGERRQIESGLVTVYAVKWWTMGQRNWKHSEAEIPWSSHESEWDFNDAISPAEPLKVCVAVHTLCFSESSFFAAVKYSSWLKGKGNRTPLPAGCSID